jgi:hypothetical protein
VITTHHVDLSGRRRSVKRAEAWGKSDIVLPCSWRTKPAVVSVSPEYVVLASESLTISSDYAHITNCHCQRDHNTLTLRMQSGSKPGTREQQLTFATAELASAAEVSIEDALRLNRARARSTRIVTNDDEQFVDCIYLGGAHLPLESAVRYDLVFREAQLEIYASPARTGHTPECVISSASIVGLDLQGPGLVRSGGGAIGGGFGLDGAAIGMAVAAVFNALTTTSRVESIIALQTTESEGFFLHQRMTPPELRRYLSPLFVRLRQIRTAHPLPSSVSNSSSSVDMVAQLEKLALLRGAGALTQPEFESAKSRLLAP